MFNKFWKQISWTISSSQCLNKIIRRNYQTLYSGMELSEVVSCLKKYAPLSLAESWDNVGLLVEPSMESHLVKSIFLTNDLTEDVMGEAIKRKADMIISYHPPIFTPFKSLTRTSWKERIILRAIENKIAIYSPHTTFDSVKGGINDWLASGLGKGHVKPLVMTFTEDERGTHRVNVLFSKDKVSVATEDLISKINKVGSVIDIDVAECGHDIHVNINCCSDALVDIMRVLNNESSELLKKTNIFNLAKMPVEDTGIGRLFTLEEEESVQTIIERIKTYLKLKNLRFASGSPKPGSNVQKNLVKTIAICAGSGGSVLRGVKADMYLTGEMTHHEVLDAVSKGIHVVLCEHSNTERGFFVDKFRDVLLNMLESKIEILVSVEDTDPITII